MIRYVSLWIFLFAICIESNSQDLHFSQYFRTPIFLNPALTGAANEDMRVVAAARNQWQTIAVPYNSILIGADTKIPFKMNRDKFGLGMMVVADRAGDGKYTTVHGALSGAYHLVTSGFSFMDLSIGSSLNYYNRSYNPDALTFDNQFNGDYFDPSIPVNEQFDRLSLSFFDVGLGLNYMQVINQLHSFNLGGSVQHFFSSEQNFFIQSQNTLLQKKYNFYGYGEYRATDRISLIPLFFYQLQEKKHELIFGGGLGFDFNPDGEERSKIKLGVSARIEDALIFWLQWEGDNNSIQISYDLNTSPLQIASNSYGGLELSYSHLINYRKDNGTRMDMCPYVWF